MPRFQYKLMVGFECEAANSDEAYDKFQKMKLEDAFWDNSWDGIQEVDENGDPIE